MLTRSAGNPSQSQSAAREVAISEDVRQTKVVVIELRVQVQKVGHVNVGRAEVVRLALVALARRRVVDSQTLHNELESVVVLEDGRLVDVVDSFDVLSHERGNLFPNFGVRLFRFVFFDVIPQKSVRLDVE